MERSDAISHLLATARRLAILFEMEQRRGRPIDRAAAIVKKTEGDFVLAMADVDRELGGSALPIYPYRERT